MASLPKNEKKSNSTKAGARPTAADKAAAAAAKIAAARNASWGWLSKVATKEFDRDAIEESTCHPATATILATVDGEEVEVSLTGALNIGADSTYASSTGPDQNHLVAYLLSLLSKNKRAEVLGELPEAYSKTGELPEVEEALIGSAENLLSRLRAQKEQKRRGNVTPVYKFGETS